METQNLNTELEPVEQTTQNQNRKQNLMILPIVGAYFRPPAMAILGVLPAGARLLLRPEPDNQFDPNAIQVICPVDSIPEAQHVELATQAEGFGFSLEDILRVCEWHVGYLPKAEAAKLSPDPDEDLPAELSFLPNGKPAVQFEI